MRHFYFLLVSLFIFNSSPLLLTNGNVLVAGGFVSDAGNDLKTTEIYELAAEIPSEGVQESPKAQAVIHFYSEVEPTEWLPNPSKVEWGFLFTKEDLVTVIENRVPGENKAFLINHPRHAEKEFLNKMATVRGIKNRTQAQFTIDAGTYDWLVLLDVEGDGVIDAYLGTSASDGPLSSYEFKVGQSYLISLDKTGTLHFKSKEQWLPILQPTTDKAQPAPSRQAVGRILILGSLVIRVFDSYLAMLVNDRGIDFEPSDSDLKAFQAAGAGEQLLKSLKSAKRLLNQPSARASSDKQLVIKHLIRGAELGHKGA